MALIYADVAKLTLSSLQYKYKGEHRRLDTAIFEFEFEDSYSWPRKSNVI